MKPESLCGSAFGKSWGRRYSSMMHGGQRTSTTTKSPIATTTPANYSTQRTAPSRSRRAPESRTRAARKPPTITFPSQLLSLPHRVLNLVPTHKLAGEARSKMPAGVTVAVWQGRGGTKLGTNEPMCRNPEAVEAALKIGANVEKTACKRRRRAARSTRVVSYQQQKAAARTADIVYAAHEILFQVPKALGKGFGLVVIDEGFWQDGLTTKSRLVISSLADEVKEFPVRDHNGGRLDYETLHLCELIERVQQALEAMPDGYVQRQPLIDAGLRPASGVEDSSCTAARKLEWERKIKTGLQPGAGEETGRGRSRSLASWAAATSAAMWHALGDLIDGNDEATGRLLIETRKPRKAHSAICVLGRKEILDKFTGLPDRPRRYLAVRPREALSAGP